MRHAPEFEAWLQSMQVIGGDGRLLARPAAALLPMLDGLAGGTGPEGERS